MHKLWFDVLCGHQLGHYREGLAKLGIADDPPAVAAAKYHYITNLIAGLAMEYVEESSRKAWIRYTAPMWVYDGIAMTAMPADLRRTVFSAWHPRNGRLMGCPRLGYVGTKFIMEGDPYDEGYFYEYDHDLGPDEILRYEHVAETPEFDPAQAPTLDPAVWPEARLVKARRNFSAGYVRTTVNVLLATYGDVAAWYLVQQTMRCLAVQYIHAFRDAQGLEGNDARTVATLFAGLLDGSFQDFETEEVSERHHRIVLRSFKPFADDASEGLRAACFHFQTMGARVLNGRLRVSRRAEGPTCEVWDIEDTGRWLY